MYSVHLLSPGMLVYVCCVAALFGAAMGSFLNCAAWRMVHEESFLTGRSRCPSCGHVLGPLDLVPLFSWLFLRGRCRYCRSRVSARYFLTEALLAALTVLCLLRFDCTVLCLRNYVYLCCLFCLSLVDLDACLIPDVCVILPALAWLAALPWTDHSLSAVAQSALSALLYAAGILLLSLVVSRVLKKDSLGLGDAYLFALMGLYLGPVASMFTVALSSMLGLLFAAVTRKGPGTPFPFGPAISAACAVMLFLGQPLTAWYLHLIGL